MHFASANIAVKADFYGEKDNTGKYRLTNEDNHHIEIGKKKKTGWMELNQMPYVAT